MSNNTLDLINEVLEEQSTLTAVERFSQKHATSTTPSLSGLYQELLPIEKPKAGQQYAFKVNLDNCSGCKSCVAACHSLNGLHEEESFRVAGTIQGGNPVEPYLQTVTSACHHCVEPACLKGCPTQAYEKDPITGIVKHLDDQCIGCQYCTLMCPYDVPKFNVKLGIVRKCDMCTQRLTDGEAPACAQSCPTQAITITVVDTEEVVALGKKGSFLSGAPTPEITKPTTQYITNKPVPKNSIAGDYYDVQLQHAHFSLIFLLVFSQLSVGMLGSYLLSSDSAQGTNSIDIIVLLSTFGMGILAMALSMFHLGRPTQAWRAILGLKTSWMSREVFMLGNYMGALATGIAIKVIDYFGIDIPWYNIIQPTVSALPILGIAFLFGLGAVLSSAMIYVATKRPFWRADQTLPKFFLTTLTLGPIGCSLAYILTGSAPTILPSILLITIITGTLKLAWEFSVLLSLKEEKLTPMKRAAILLAGKLKFVGITRMTFGAAGLILFPFLSIQILTSGNDLNGALFFLVLAALSGTVGEIIERFAFFAAVDKPRMPREMI
ncbi:MAG: dimethyl sulfoxide reductase anchor subunit [Fibrobacterales bacterium]